MIDHHRPINTIFQNGMEGYRMKTTPTKIKTPQGTWFD